MILLNGVEVNKNFFPNGELNLLDIQEAIGKASSVNEFVLKYESDNDLMALYFIKKQVDVRTKGEKALLSMYYCPYSRMDRAETPETPFTLKFFCEFINGMGFDEVKVYEPHSDVTLQLLNNVKKEDIVLNLLPHVMEEIGFNFNEDYIVFPDETAFKRYGSINLKNSLITKKKRDFNSGRIVDLTIEGEVRNKPFNALMVDDLCSRGGTFLLNAQKLKELGANKIYLLVGHCEDTVFDGDIFSSGLVEKIFTTNSILKKNTHWENLKHKDKLVVYDMG